jgi:mRNA interferase MazF
MMRNGTMLRHGDIVLIPVPFTDLSSQKRRPVVIISNDVYQQQTQDIVVVAMTSNIRPTEYGFVITTEDLVEGILNRPSQIRVDKIYALAQSIVVKTFGRVSDKNYLTNSSQLTKPNIKLTLSPLHRNSK